MQKVPSRRSPIGLTRANANKAAQNSGWVYFEELKLDKATSASIYRNIRACKRRNGKHSFDVAFDEILRKSGSMSRSLRLSGKNHLQALIVILAFSFVIVVNGQSPLNQTATQVSPTQPHRTSSPRPTTWPTTKLADIRSHSYPPFPAASQIPSTYPSPSPSMLPSTPEPTNLPSISPSFHPTGAPSDAPSAAPTLNAVSMISRMYTQRFEGYGLKKMKADQIVQFEWAFANYTFEYSDPVRAKVETVCKVTSQGVYESRRIRNLRQRSAFGIEHFSAFLRPSFGMISETLPKKRLLQSTAELSNTDAILVDYTIHWSSLLTKLEDDDATHSYEHLFVSWVNKNSSKETIKTDLQGFGMPVESVGDVFVVEQRPTPSPTAAPSYPVSASPTSPPSVNEEALADKMTSIIIGATSAAAAVFVASLALILFARRRDAVACDNTQSTKTKNFEGCDVIDDVERNSESFYTSTHQSSPEASPQKSDSRPRFQEYSTSDISGLSASILTDVSRDHSRKEASTVRLSDEFHIEDEFDPYKNQKLEKMRSKVERAVTDMDSMMSHALTRALMDDDDASRDVNDLVWGGAANSMEIEAYVLCETNNWLKRTEDASKEERRTFMQNLLTKMVASVRFNIIAPEKASLTIHGAAAMLGLQLAGEMPQTVIIVIGMRKKAQSDDLLTAFEEFGTVEDAAVSPDERGFGFVRYVSARSARRAMERFRTDEIVVQDVSVNVRLISEFVRGHE